MSASCSVSRRLLAAMPALLLSTAIGTPAMAQIETVVVTAQKRPEDIQNVPISMTALSGQELAATGTTSFRDLQFEVPSVTFSKGNFGANNFEIRGIGLSAVGTSADTGVAVNHDGIYVESSVGMATAEYFDIDRIEVLRGPQSTLYGRNATGGTVNIITNRPNLTDYKANIEGTFGTYGTRRLSGMLNVPIVPGELAARAAGLYAHHDGFVTNITNNQKIDSEDEYLLRGSLRWRPSTKTTVDLIVNYAHEDDSHMRATKQLCHRDPTGVLGCLPDRLGFDPPNGNAGFPSTLASIQTWGTVGGMLGKQLAAATGANLVQTLSMASAMQNILGGLGITNLQLPNSDAYYGAQAPRNMREVAIDVSPVNRQQSRGLTGIWQQQLFDWLHMQADFGYLAGSYTSRQPYYFFQGRPLSAAIGSRVGYFASLPSTASLAAPSVMVPSPPYPLPILSGAQFFAATFPNFNPAPYLAAFFSSPGGIGVLPMSGTTNTGNNSANGIVAGNVYDYAGNLQMMDQSGGATNEKTAEVRFDSGFTGPLNFRLGLYWLDSTTNYQYWANSNFLDYGAILAGALLGNLAAGAHTNGLVGATPYYTNDVSEYSLHSRAVYGEVYYDIVPDALKLTLGLRWTQDRKHQIARSTLSDTLVPIGTANIEPYLATIPGFSGTLLGTGTFDADPSQPGKQLWADQRASFSQDTGRAVIGWTPKLEFTDQTLLYASYARGFKSGGINPPLSAATTAVPQYFKPEGLDAYELGTKNILLDGTLQANGDLWYYNYKDYQIAEIVNRTSVNNNVNATLWGAEASLMWAPDSHWTFNLSLTNTNTSVASGVSIIDQRNPTNNYPNSILVKDIATGANCVVLPDAAHAGHTMAEVPGSGFFAPPGGTAALAGYGVPEVNYGICGLTLPGGYSYAPGGGIPRNLSGNQLPQTPQNTISIGAQYSMDLGADYGLVARLDYYWQSAMFTTVFNDAPDRIGAWDTMNLSLQLNAPDDWWYARLYATNVFNKANITGAHLGDPSTSLFTNVFVEDPRIVGLVLGASL